MPRRMLPRGIKKFIRKEKARLRREISDPQEYDRLIKELYEKYKRV